LKNIITGEDVDIAFESGEKKLFQTARSYHKYSKGKKGRVRDSLATSAVVAPAPSSFPTRPFDIEYWRKQFPILKTHFHVAKNMLSKVFRSARFWIPLLASS